MRGQVAMLALTLELLGCAGGYLDPLPEQAVRHRTKTGDGWELALVQYKPAGSPVAPRGRPVLLCHGILANDRTMDLDAEHSLARWLARHGREAWTLSLRGTGDSDRVDSALGRRGGFNFDTFWRQDYPAAIDYVRRQSGSAELDFIGHSMGGMLAYAYLSQGGEGVSNLVILGSPTRLDWGGAFDPVLDRLGRAVVSKEYTLPTALLARAFAGLQGEWEEDPVQLVLVNPRNTSPRTMKRLVAMGTGDVSGALVLWFLRMVRSGRFESDDGVIDFRRDMRKIRIPALVIAGKADRVAIVPAVKDGHRALGGPKEWRIIGEENGARADYGHMDLVLGDRASTEVWPAVLDFLDRHSAVPPTR